MDGTRHNYGSADLGRGIGWDHALEDAVARDSHPIRDRQAHKEGDDADNQ